MLGLVWQAVPVFVLTWILVALITRYSSLAALIASVAATDRRLHLRHAGRAASSSSS